MNSGKKALFARCALYGTLLTFLGLAASALHSEGYLNGHPKATELRLTGTAAEMAKTYGSKQGPQIRLLTKRYVAQGICRNNQRLLNDRTGRALRIFEKMDDNWQEELTAMSSSAKADKGLLALGNAFLDIGHAPIGCRTVVLDTKNTFLHAHNLDWDDLGGMARDSLLVVRRNPTGPALRTVSLCYPGMIGVLDTVNEKGVALSFNELGMGNGVCSEPMFIMMRRIIEQSHTFADARTAILKAPEGMPFILTLSGAKTRQASVFERQRTVIEERHMNTAGFLAAGNAAFGQNASRSPQYKILHELNPSNVDGVQKHLRHERILLSCNIYSAIFNFNDNVLLLASGKIPAAHSEYRKFILFE